MSWAEQEQASLIETFRTADPDAPTLCEGWDVRRLLAHLVQRAQRPIATITDAVSRKPPGQEPGLTDLTSGAKTRQGYEALIDRFGRGARWSPLSLPSDRINLVEYVVHHEDIRRAGDEPAGPRNLPAAEQLAVWQRTGTFARFGLRKSPVGVRLVTPDDQSRVVKTGEGVTLTGEPVELALWVSGRRGPAQVAVTGSDEAITAFGAWAQVG